MSVCSNTAYDASGIPNVCWCNEYKPYERHNRQRALSTAKRSNPQYYGKAKS